MYPFVTACCGMEFMAMASPRFDIARFGAEAPRFSPRQSDLLWVVGTISQRQAPVLKRIYEQMADPKWVLAFGTCASCGGFYDNYTTSPGIDKIIPCDIYVPGCPPRPEAVLDGLMLLQDKIAARRPHPGIVKPRTDPVDRELAARTASSCSGRAACAEPVASRQLEPKRPWPKRPRAAEGAVRRRDRSRRTRSSATTPPWSSPRAGARSRASCATTRAAR